MPEFQHHLVGLIDINIQNHSATVAEVIEKVLRGSHEVEARGACSRNVFSPALRVCPALTSAAVVYADLERLTEELQREYGQLAIRQ